MRIERLEIKCNRLEDQKNFFKEKLGLDIIESSGLSFSVQVGWTEFIFKKDSGSNTYHYCFLIPSNQLDSSIEWLQKSEIELVKSKGKVIIPFKSWNAESVYFYDGDGNIAEFIVRHDYPVRAEGEFSAAQILAVNEIGACSTDVAKTNSFLTENCGTSFYKGNTTRFGTNGDLEGIFLLINNLEKEVWFPTQLPTQASDFLVELNEKGKRTSLAFIDGAFKLLE